MGYYENCDHCNVNVLIPWSADESNQAEYDLRPGVVICTQQCYFDHLADQAEHMRDCMLDR